MAAPNLRVYPQPSVSGAAGSWDRTWEIDSVLAQLSSGQFGSPALFCDQMLRDDRINGVRSTRVGALLATPLEFKAAGTRRKAERVAELLADTDEGPGLWWQMFSPAVLGDLSDWGTMLNCGVAEIIWRTEEDRWLPTLRLWHPQFVYWDWNDFRYKLRTRDGTVDLPDIEQNPHGDGKWVMWMPRGYQYGWRHALVRALAFPYVGRQWNFRDWARHNEKHGMPTDKVFVPEGAPREDKEAFFADVVNRGSDAAVMVPVPSDGRDKGYDVEVLEAQARTWEAFQTWKKELDTDIAIAILGQNLTTEGGSQSSNGSRALGQVQENVRIDKLREDARIARCLREQVLTWWALYNFGDAELAPLPSFMTEPPEDEAASAGALKTLGEALVALDRAYAPVDVRAVLDRAGVPMLSEEDVAEEEEMASEEAAQAAPDPEVAEGGGGELAAAVPRPASLAALRSTPRRIVIVGGPRTGKTTTSAEIARGAPVRHTDDLIAMGWSEASAEVARWMDEPGPWVIEGTAAARGLRKWLAAHTFGKPCDEVLVLWDPHVPLTPGQRSMAGGVRVVFGEIVSALRARGVEVRTGGEPAELRIVREDDGWHVYSDDGSKHLGGPYKTKAEARHRLAQVEAHKRG